MKITEQEIIESGLFVFCVDKHYSHRFYRIPETNFEICFHSGTQEAYFHAVEYRTGLYKYNLRHAADLEEILNYCPEMIKNYFLFNLDLFR